MESNREHIVSQGSANPSPRGGFFFEQKDVSLFHPLDALSRCFNRWQPGHSSRDCSQTITTHRCLIGGHSGVSLEECPRCNEAYRMSLQSQQEGTHERTIEEELDQEVTIIAHQVGRQATVAMSGNQRRKERRRQRAAARAAATSLAAAQARDRRIEAENQRKAVETSASPCATTYSALKAKIEARIGANGEAEKKKRDEQSAFFSNGKVFHSRPAAVSPPQSLYAASLANATLQRLAAEKTSSSSTIPTVQSSLSCQTELESSGPGSVVEWRKLVESLHDESPETRNLVLNAAAYCALLHKVKGSVKDTEELFVE